MCRGNELKRWINVLIALTIKGENSRAPGACAQSGFSQPRLPPETSWAAPAGNVLKMDIRASGNLLNKEGFTE